MSIKTASAALLIAGLAPSPAAPTDGPGAKVRVTGEPERHGTLRADGAELKLETADGGSHTVDLGALRRLEVDIPRVPLSVDHFGVGELPEPWLQTAVGELPHGGLAEAKGDKAQVATSSPEASSPFDAFYMAYRPLPEGDAQITVRVKHIDSYENTTRGGVMLRDGTDAKARNVFLSMSNRERAAMRVWRGAEEGDNTTDRRDKIRPGKWLRLERSGGAITGYVSEDSGFWREIASIDDPFEGQVYACLVSQGKKPRRRWSTIFQNIDVTPISVSGPIRAMRPRITLADGTVFHSEIESASTKLFKLTGENAGRVLPAATIARVEFYRPIAHSRRGVLDGERAGVLLPDGDFFEADLGSITPDGRLLATSTLFGKREFEISVEVDALVLRPAKERPPPGEYQVETWAGTHLSGENLRVEKGQIAIDTVRLRTQLIPLEKLRRIVRDPPK